MQEVTMTDTKADDVRPTVRDHYGNIARAATTGCAPGCCDAVGTDATKLGYTPDAGVARDLPHRRRSDEA
jgi:hypothetical protein